MRILLRNFDKKPYVWKDCEFKDGKYAITTADEIFGDFTWNPDETDIIAVDGVENSQVVCQHCGEIIENTPEAIEAHFAAMEKKKDCINCDNLVFDNKPKIIEREAEKIGSIYRVTQTMDTRLYCKMGWNTNDIDSSNAKSNCKYLACRKKGVKTFDDIFHRYPGVFDSVITVEALKAKNLRYDGFNGRYFIYDMKSRGTIKACVNEAGVVECFLVSSNGNRIYYCYSEKYDKLFYINGSKYLEGCPYWFRDTKFEEAHKKIKALYEGAK